MAVGQGRDGAATRRRGWLVALALAVVLAAGAGTALVVLGDGDGAGTPAPSGQLALGDVTEVELDDEGRAVRTFAAEEHVEYLVHTPDGGAAFLPPASTHAPVTIPGAAYSLPEPAAGVLVTGEPGATVRVWLQTLEVVEPALPGEVSGRLAPGDCVDVSTATGGVPRIAVGVTGTSEAVEWGFDGEHPDEAAAQIGTDAAGNPVFDVSDRSALGYRVCNTGAETAGWELTVAEHVEPGESPSPPPTVDGADEVTGELVPGVPVSHEVTVPAHRSVSVTVWPGVGADFDARLTVTDQGQQQVVDRFPEPGSAEFADLRGGDADRVVGIEVVAVSGGGSYRITVG